MPIDAYKDTKESRLADVDPNRALREAEKTNSAQATWKMLALSARKRLLKGLPISYFRSQLDLLGTYSFARKFGCPSTIAGIFKFIGARTRWSSGKSKRHLELLSRDAWSHEIPKLHRFS